MDAIEQSDAIEHATITRLAEIYAGALRTALKKKKAFLKKIKDVDSGKIKPPAYYVDTDTVDKWREGFVRELLRQDQVIDGIMEELNAAGVQASELIRGSMVDVYKANRDESVTGFEQSAGEMGVNVAFSLMDKKQIDVILRAKEPPFSRIAYNNLGSNPAVRRRLQRELGQAAALGESQAKLIARIRKVTGQTVSQAKRLAQTERTRVQSQARYEAAEEARAQGLELERVWHTRMHHSRDSHIALNGSVVDGGQPFISGLGSTLYYPGDSEHGAPAEDVINCHCYTVERVKTNSEAALRLRRMRDEQRKDWLEGTEQNGIYNHWRDVLISDPYKNFYV